MKKSFLIAILCMAMLACSVTAYAEPESSVSGNTTEEEGSESTPDLHDVFTFIASSPQGDVSIEDFRSGDTLYFETTIVDVTFTPEWEGAEVVEYQTSAADTSNSNYSITDNQIIIYDAQDSDSYTFYISSITVRKDGTTLTYDLDIDEFGSATSWTFILSPSLMPEQPEEDRPSGTVSGNSAVSSTDSSAPADNTSSNEDSSDAPSEVVVKNVVNINGANVTSTISGVYIPTSVSGVAVKTAYETVLASAGVIGSDDAGEIVLYVCDNTSRQEQTAFSEAAALLGARVISMIDMDMYHFTLTDCQTVKTLTAPIEITIALPEWAVRQGDNFSILCVDSEGNLLNLPDTDSSAQTITILTNTLGTFAIVAQ